MDILVKTQADVFLVSIIYGACLTVLYDVFRCFRRVKRHGRISTGFEDVIYCMIFTCSVISLIYTYNNGELRGYVVLGMALGSVLYLVLLSSPILFVSSFLLGKVIRIFVKFAEILTNPIKKRQKTKKCIEKYTKQG